MARKGIRTSTVAVIPPAKVQIDELVNRVYERALPIIPTGHAKKRLDDREVTLQEIRQVLSRSGSRKTQRTSFARTTPLEMRSTAGPMLSWDAQRTDESCVSVFQS